VLDGVYEVDEVAGEARFIALPPPGDDDIERVLAAVARKTLRVLSQNPADRNLSRSNGLRRSSKNGYGLTLAASLSYGRRYPRLISNLLLRPWPVG